MLKRKTFYALSQPSMQQNMVQYGIIVWGTAKQAHLECLRVRLSKILRIILSRGVETPITNCQNVQHPVVLFLGSLGFLGCRKILRVLKKDHQ